MQRARLRSAASFAGHVGLGRSVPERFPLLGHGARRGALRVDAAHAH